MTPLKNDSSSARPETRVVRVQYEHLQETLGIGTPRPRLSWQTETGQTGWLQSAYEIEAVTPSGAVIGQTGKVASPESVLVDWPFAPLSSRQRVTVRVRVWDSSGQVSAWSDPAPAEVGLLEPGDWKAQAIRPDWDDDLALPQRGPLLRKAFSLRQGIQRARLYVTALGLYEVASTAIRSATT